MSRKILMIIFMSIFTVYLAGMLLFSGFYYPYTKINGIESGLKRPEEIIDMEKRKIDNICLVIRSDQMDKKTYPGIASLDEEFDFRMILEAQKSWMWPLKVLKKHEWHAGKIKYTDPSLIARELYREQSGRGHSTQKCVTKIRYGYEAIRCHRRQIREPADV